MCERLIGRRERARGGGGGEENEPVDRMLTGTV